MKYSEQILNYFHHRTHAGSLDSTQRTVRRVQVGHADNREILVLTVDYQDSIVAAKFQATGSVALIAGGEFICTWLENKTWQDLSSLTPEYILESLQLSRLNIHVANLLVTAVKKLEAKSGCA